MEGKIILNQVQIEEQIGSGASGVIHKGTNIVTGEKYAVKFESLKKKKCTLKWEYDIYEQLQGEEGIPSVHWFSRNSEMNIMACELLGPTLEQLFHRNKFMFSLKTVLLIADQMFDRLEIIHNKGFVHRDLKPSNIVVGFREKAQTLYIIDFGVSKSYLQIASNEHIINSQHADFFGSIKFASLNTHKGADCSRRDDMEALAYMLAYFLKGFLPWQYVPKCLNNHQKIAEVNIIKQTISSEQLLFGFPDLFVEFLEYAKQMEFSEIPKYAYYKNAFRELATRYEINYDGEFEWAHDHRSKMESQNLPLV